jgi:hypothetical protein
MKWINLIVALVGALLVGVVVELGVYLQGGPTWAMSGFAIAAGMPVLILLYGLEGGK